MGGPEAGSTVNIQNVTYSVVGEIVTNDVFNSTFDDAVSCEDEGESLVGQESFMACSVCINFNHLQTWA